MKWTSLNELREDFLSFFESKGHLRLESFSLIPSAEDKSLLLINSGMAPMKKYFTGEEEPPRHRVCTCQKCIRTGDIDNVGKTARHGTFFEMLGNFSFGDYFKTEAIEWSWEFLTKTLEIPAELLYPSVYEQDDEAYALWRDKIGVPESHIVRLGKADNFWEHGSGPCGPCSEIYFDRGLKYGCGSPDCRPGCECDRFIEIWNNVFSQFNNDGEGNYTELATKNIDTGMGLERLACVMQGVDNLFEVDTIRRVLDTVCELSGTKYGEEHKKDVSVRVITDHIRSATFMICDGVLPSNEGRGYVLRRLLRRAARHGKLLGITGQFLGKLCDVVIEQSGDAYPTLREKKDYIKKIISLEEERFDATIDGGLNILSGFITDALSKGEKTLRGEDVFKLYDTFGFPPDLTAEIAAEKGLDIDNDGFTALMTEQKERARAARADLSSWDSASGGALSELAKTEFCGYDSDSADDAKVLCIIANGEAVDSVSEGCAEIVLDKTPFYGEGGGQVGDKGEIASDGFACTVTDTKKTDGIYIHHCDIESGMVSVGDTVRAAVDSVRRGAIRRNHSGVHLLQAALRQVLGSHVEQAGSYVDENRLRFDFNHFAAVTHEELKAVEAAVNAAVLAALPVVTKETDIETAKAEGAMALFGEKYGKTVRMVKMGDFSTELCGGTHASNTAELGLFRIISESGVAAGVRRIEAVTGSGVLALLDEREALIADTASALKSTAADMPAKVRQLQGEVSKLKKEIDALNSKLAGSKLDEIIASAETVGSVKLCCADLGATGADAARALGDKIRDKDASGVAVLAIHDGEKLNFIVSCGADAVKAGAHAGKIVGAVAAVCGGKGGGRPDSAMSGGKDITKIADALAAAKDIVAGMLK